MSQNKIFAAEQFTPTEFSTAQEKAKFANHFAKFAMNNCPREMFPKWFYQRLSTCFGHFAHFNADGFYQDWFSTWKKREHFLNYTIVYPCYGEPEYTYCDVEKALIAWMTKRIMLL